MESISAPPTPRSLTLIRSRRRSGFPAIHVLDVPQYVAPGPHRSAPHAAVVSVSGRSGIHRRLRARAGRDRAHQVRAFRQKLAVESRRRSHREDPAVGRAGRRTRSFAGGSVDAHLEASGRRMAEAPRLAARRTQRRAHSPRELRRRGPRADRDGRARSRHRKADAARRARRRLLFLDRQRSGALAKESVRRTNRCWSATSGAAPAILL